MKAITSKMGRFVVLATAIVAMAGCASTPKTFANADPTIDFGSFRTFGFASVASTDTQGYESLETRHLKSAIAAEMENRGLAESGDPDLLINVYVDTAEKLRSYSVPRSGIAFYDPYYDSWGGFGGWGTEVRQFTEGTLTIDIVDAGARKMVWKGAAVGQITDRNRRDLEGTISDAVAEIMKDYPVMPLG